MRAATAVELAAIRRLQKVLKTFPKTLRLQVDGNGLKVLLCEEGGAPYLIGDLFDQEAIVAYIDVLADGGDPW